MDHPDELYLKNKILHHDPQSVPFIILVCWWPAQNSYTTDWMIDVLLICECNTSFTHFWGILNLKENMRFWSQSFTGPLLNYESKVGTDKRHLQLIIVLVDDFLVEDLFCSFVEILFLLQKFLLEFDFMMVLFQLILMTGHFWQEPLDNQSENGIICVSPWFCNFPFGAIFILCAIYALPGKTLNWTNLLI